ncbi:MAG: DUF4376 domain-containing protein [Eggerthellaceae bacterium]|nr:DUF4376 domain-containing protein [Eggerthellaceae bacterium]
MKIYSKIIDGKIIIKRADEIVVKGNGSQTFNPTESMILADGWTEYVAPVYEPTLEDVKQGKIDEILAYDSSEAVNEFSIGGVPMWLDKATRAGLMLRFQAEQAKATAEDNETPMTTLWSNGQSYTLPLQTAQQILIALELYASACYDNTQSHIAEVQKMESKEAVEAYDYTGGYPEKLSF